MVWKSKASELVTGFNAAPGLRNIWEEIGIPEDQRLQRTEVVKRHILDMMIAEEENLRQRLKKSIVVYQKEFHTVCQKLVLDACLPEEDWAQMMKEELREQKEAACFKAWPNSVVYCEPFQPKEADQSLIERFPSMAQEKFELATEKRAEERKDFEKRKAEKEAMQEKFEQEKKKEAKEHERDETARLRQELVDKANPVRHYKKVDIKPSVEQLDACCYIASLNEEKERRRAEFVETKKLKEFNVFRELKADEMNFKIFKEHERRKRQREEQDKARRERERQKRQEQEELQKVMSQRNTLRAETEELKTRASKKQSLGIREEKLNQHLQQLETNKLAMGKEKDELREMLERVQAPKDEMKRTLQRNTELKMEEKVDVKVKQEAPDPVALETRILELCQQFPQGITDQVIQNDMPQVEPQKRAMVINRLLPIGQLDLLRGTAGLLYRIKDSQTASKMKGSDNQEKLGYQIIEDAGNKGIWSRDIRYKSNFPLTEINKILNMESKKLSKAVKSEASLEVITRSRNEMENEKIEIQKQLEKLEIKLQESQENNMQSEIKILKLENALFDKERDRIATSQKIQEAFSASSQEKEATKKLKEHIQQLEIENTKLEVVAKQQTNKSELMEKEFRDTESVCARLEDLITSVQEMKVIFDVQFSHEVDVQKKNVETRLGHEMERNEHQKEVDRRRTMVKMTKIELKENLGQFTQELDFGCSEPNSKEQFICFIS